MCYKMTEQRFSLFICFILMLFTVSSVLAESTAFISTWQTTSDNDDITIPTTGGGYNYAIDCGTGGLIGGAQTATGQTGDATCNMLWTHTDS